MTTPTDGNRRFPETRRGDHVELYQRLGGQEAALPDPYRWLEDAESPETRKWVEAQNEHAAAYLSAQPLWDIYRARLTELWNFPKSGVPWHRGASYFRTFNPGLLNQPRLEVAAGPHGPWRGLLDPNLLSEDGTVSLTAASVSRDGHWLAYSTQSGGSDWLTWQVRDVATGENGPDLIEWSKFSDATWHPDGSGFYYAAYDAPQPGEALTGTNRDQRLMFHRLGTAQADDQVVLSRSDQPDWGFRQIDITDDGRFLVVEVWLGTSRKNQLWVQELGSAQPFVELVGEFRAGYHLIGSEGDELLLLTDEDAPLNRVLRWNISTGERRDVLAQGAHQLDSVSLVKDGLLAVTLHDASHRLHLYSRSGERHGEIALPGLGTLQDLHTQPGDSEVFFGFDSFLAPLTPYRLQLPNTTPEVLGDTLSAQDTGASQDTGAYEVTQTFIQSSDGTRVPYFLIAARTLTRDGTNPTLLYGYGGFGVSVLPSFNPGMLAWLERGGVFAVANLRGGGEYGTAWHQGGMLDSKQNVFDDFIAVAEHLISTGVTSAAHLGIQGVSNGGLLVGAAMTQRPELFAAAVPQVGVMDMLRYHLFTVGWSWASDYGRSDDPQMFDVLRAYSPLHNLREGTRYPATLITTGDHDDRVVPAHSYKFAAELQRCQASEAPTLIRIQTRAGHGAGKPTALLIEEAADLFTFLEVELKGTDASQA
ncbi:S9 family peptidase [Deinococcus detaillensis]|uniref:prolyl oligopeptidase n=1 Tax=Deinococcus detaillensis TaxID=2592048 RepID=A0A553UKN7_9DEIO|nr:prolyl oligopeptidase family serine peptidase [Deinococcus detaillensis]TSA80770.1 S9 family peptidase [Deinococcus detaillensis]